MLHSSSRMTQQSNKSSTKAGECVVRAAPENRKYENVRTGFLKQYLCNENMKM